VEQRKYEFTGETLQYANRTLKRIRRLSDGLVGGYIESERNLSHKDSCFVYGNAQVYGSARVFDSALVSGDARVCNKDNINRPSEVLNIVGLPWGITFVPTGVRVGCQQVNYTELTEERLIAIAEQHRVTNPQLYVKLILAAATSYQELQKMEGKV
jgi:hypothetical protein